MNRFFQSLFRKNQQYVLVWSYIISLHENLENIRLSIPEIIGMFNIPRSTLLRIIQFGCSKLDIRYSVKFGILQFHYEAMKKKDDPKQIRIDLGDADIPVIPSTDAMDAVLAQKKEAGKEMSVNEVAREVIQYLNDKLMQCDWFYMKRGFNAKTRDTITHIQVRLNEGYKLQDFFKVVDNKFEEWADNEKMRKFLRPSTLFNTNFDKYLNQINETGEMKIHKAIAEHNSKPVSRIVKISNLLNHYDKMSKEGNDDNEPEK